MAASRAVVFAGLLTLTVAASAGCSRSDTGTNSAQRLKVAPAVTSPPRAFVTTAAAPTAPPETCAANDDRFDTGVLDHVITSDQPRVYTPPSADQRPGVDPRTVDRLPGDGPFEALLAEMSYMGGPSQLVWLIVVRNVREPILGPVGRVGPSSVCTDGMTVADAMTGERLLDIEGLRYL